MHRNAELIRKFYTSLANRDARGMAACYHPAVTFSDEVFIDLEGVRANGMWQMLCERAKDLKVEFRDIEADESAGRAHWEAWYTFSASGRRVHNKIDARFEFRDGKIIRHRDTFDFWAWASQALGPIGRLLGWSRFLKNRVRTRAAKGLAAFLRERGQGEHNNREHTLTSVHVLVFEGFADWEPAHALAELRRSGNRSVVVVGFNPEPVTSMGGLRVVPERQLKDVRRSEVEIFILPGGDLWESTYPRAELERVLSDLIAADVPVAAICGGTLAIARMGLLDDRRHTSNGPGYIAEHVPQYSGAALYEAIPAVSDRGVITASGLAPVDFAREIFKQLRIFSPADEELWFDMFKSGRLGESAVD